MKIYKTIKGQPQKYPSYEEILAMEENKAQKIFLERHALDPKSLLEEMIDHEEKTGSFLKTARGKIKPTEQAILNVFNRTKSREVVGLFDEVDSLLVNSKDGAPRLTNHAVFAKFASDLHKPYKK